MAVAAAIISAVVNIALAVTNAQNQRATARYNEGVKRNQATALENAGVVERGDLRMKMARDIAYQKSIAASKGVSLESGSSLSIFKDTELNSDIAVMRAKYNTDQKAQALRGSASLERSQGENAAVATLVGGVASGVAELGKAGADAYAYAESG
ncbi:hypothetical protein BJAS_P3968 [Bathymodiolus japonicus methanotrophic gill symbiont]|uniref:hypothetical protein n=1 Tax=Bathymodiolus japonicus methanotrophic gill symbiont TaxID=113269 RepID=UPI001B6B4425|nr:hypothetical protein [Bathymodiolus japonicus methanotrophic gill symbiont]GFO73256.1 hypothetical protein BJAS_P3968 [Bathymodiolus japonicus methanotrophic gill symbiont]